MKDPAKIICDQHFMSMLASTSAGLKDGRWVPARPIGWAPGLSRFRRAWDVFTGKADALYWVEQ